jgi:P63C domain
MGTDNEGKARGGDARARKLTPAKRTEIARKAARERWSTDVAKAVCGSPDKPLAIGDVEIECYVLEDGTRVITQASFLEAIGRHRRSGAATTGARSVMTGPSTTTSAAFGSGAGESDLLPPFLRGQNIRPFISQGVSEASRPINFTLPRGGRARGYNAELLPAVCEVYLAARQAGELPANQDHVAKQAEILVRGLARVGIIALVDEATGYQEVRAKNALANILETFIDKELQAWVQTFPDDYYREIFRLRGLNYPQATVQRPQYFGHLTNDIVYKRLAPGVLEELKRVQHRNDAGRPRNKLFQRLTSNVGYPKLREHLGSVVAIMKLSDNWSDFKLKLDRIHPRLGDDMMLPFEQDEPTTGL